MRELKMILILLIGSVFACKKVETPPSYSIIPIFGLTANLSGDSLKIEAGEDDYYLFTSFETDANNVRSFVGTFVKIDCLDECQDTFRIKIRDAQTLPQNGGNINDALFVGSYDFKNNEDTFSIEIDTIYNYSATFDASASVISNPISTEYFWTIDGESVPGSNSILNYDFNNQPDDIIDINLLLNSDGFISEQSAKLSFSPDNLMPECFSRIIVESSLQMTFLEVDTLSGIQPFTYLWSNESTEKTVEADTAFYAVTVTDGSGCESISSIYLDSPFGGNAISQAQFTISTMVDFMEIPDTTFMIDPLQLSTITIEYVDENGVFYSSELESQPANAAFQILSVDDFDNNENDEKTKQLDIEFNCILGSEAAVPPLQLTGGNGKIAVAYPD